MTEPNRTIALTTEMEARFLRRGTLLIQVDSTPTNRRLLMALADTLEQHLPSGTIARHVGEYALQIIYKPQLCNIRDVVKTLKVSVDSAHLALGIYAPRHTSLGVKFVEVPSSDLSLASLMMNVSERALVRLLCRTTRPVTGIARPSASPILQFPAGENIPPTLVTSRLSRGVPRGTLLLSSEGLTLVADETFSGALLLGQICSADLDRLRELRMGGRVRLTRFTDVNVGEQNRMAHSGSMLS